MMIVYTSGVVAKLCQLRKLCYTIGKQIIQTAASTRNYSSVIWMGWCKITPLYLIYIALSLSPPSFVLLYMYQLVQVVKKSCVDTWNTNNAQSQLKFRKSSWYVSMLISLSVSNNPWKQLMDDFVVNKNQTYYMCNDDSYIANETARGQL